MFSCIWFKDVFKILENIRRYENWYIRTLHKISSGIWLIFNNCDYSIVQSQHKKNATVKDLAFLQNAIEIWFYVTLRFRDAKWIGYIIRTKWNRNWAKLCDKYEKWKKWRAFWCETKLISIKNQKLNCIRMREQHVAIHEIPNAMS